MALDTRIDDSKAVGIQLDRERKLYYGLNALHAFRARHQKNIFRVIDKELVQTDTDGQAYVDPYWLTALLHVGLVEDDRGITAERVAELVHESCTASGEGYQTQALAIATVIWEAFVRARLITPSQINALLAKMPDIAAWLVLRNGQSVELANYARDLFGAAVAGDAPAIVSTALQHAAYTPAAIDEVLAVVRAQAPAEVQAPAEGPEPDPTGAAEASAA